MADKLPLEIIEKILKYLKPSDRLVASTICLLWYEASLTMSLWKDVVITFENSLDDAACVFQWTRKPVQDLKIQEINFSASTPGLFEFWSQISRNLLSLEIHGSYITEANLLNLLLQCQSLESLHFHNCRDTFITGKLFSNDLVLSHIKLAMPNLKKLAFSENSSYFSDALLDRFMALVVSLKYLSFSATTISFHPGINKKFYSKNNGKGENKSSELVLTFDCMLQHIVEHSKTVEHLDFSQTLIDDKACISLSKVAGLKLHSLILRSCEVSSTGISGLCATQSTLTELDISSCVRITDNALSSICSLLPNLQKLSIQNCRAVTDMGISYLSQLCYLSYVNLQGLQNITSLGVENGLLSKRNETLTQINLSNTRMVEETLHQLAKNSPFLTHLNLTSCKMAVSDSSLRVVLNSLLHLRELLLDWCISLTDDGFADKLTVTKLAIQDDGNFQDKPLEAPCSKLKENCTPAEFYSFSGLIHLSVGGCNKLTDRSLQYAFRFRELRHLDLNACPLITDIGLVALSEQNRGIEILILNYGKFTDYGMTKAISYLSRLRRLSLHGCLNLTKLTLNAIEKYQLRYLSHLNISHCRLISLEDAFQFQLRMPSIRELDTAGLE
ncbi:F-box/LRR-repeat protein 7-like [Daphnia carinata]|uniref:F-box/LRR-repeat protein 7-like n=1 Tax=Daphnia carinata TaxID=120202 RepID=UPI00257B7316|nr:F-box/LRR-repeat protein 7-like [Daphnia carinata]